MQDIGARLQSKARELGLSDAEVARRLGLAQGRYSNYVNGSREPDFGTFVRICTELRLTPNEVLGFGEPEAEIGKGTTAKINALLTTFDPDQLELALGLLTALADHQASLETTGSGAAGIKKASASSHPKP